MEDQITESSGCIFTDLGVEKPVTVPRHERGEVVGGGYLIFRRGKKTGRVGYKPHSMPFEHGSYESAKKEVARLEEANPGEKFHIFADMMIHQF